MNVLVFVTVGLHEFGAINLELILHDLVRRGTHGQATIRQVLEGGPPFSNNESAQHFDSEKLSQFVFIVRDSNLWSLNPLDLEAEALPIEPPRQLL